MRVAFLAPPSHGARPGVGKVGTGQFFFEFGSVLVSYQTRFARSCFRAVVRSCRRGLGLLFRCGTFSGAQIQDEHDGYSQCKEHQLQQRISDFILLVELGDEIRSGDIDKGAGREGD